MRRVYAAAVACLIALPALPTEALSQETWPDYTQDQQWDRMTRLGSLGTVAAMAYAKSQGADLEEFGKWWGDLFAPGWGQPGAYGPVQAMRGMRRNFLAWKGMTFEILSESDAAVSARFTRPWVAYFGDNGTWYGVTLEEYEHLNFQFMERIAEYHGLSFEEHRDGEGVVITFARR